MKHALVIKTEEGSFLSLVNDHNGNIAWFYGHIIHDNLRFKRASTFPEFQRLIGDNRYESVYTETYVEFPTSWKVIMKNNNTLRLMRSIGKKTQFADLEITTGNKVMTDVVKNIDLTSGKDVSKDMKFYYTGKFPVTVAEMLPGFKAIKMRA